MITATARGLDEWRQWHSFFDDLIQSEEGSEPNPYGEPGKLPDIKTIEISDELISVDVTECDYPPENVQGVLWRVDQIEDSWYEWRGRSYVTYSVGVQK